MSSFPSFYRGDASLLRQVWLRPVWFLFFSLAADVWFGSSSGPLLSGLAKPGHSSSEVLHLQQRSTLLSARLRKTKQEKRHLKTALSGLRMIHPREKNPLICAKYRGPSRQSKQEKEALCMFPRQETGNACDYIKGAPILLLFSPPLKVPYLKILHKKIRNKKFHIKAP